LKILFVCMGNICRSPLAMGVLRKQLEAHKIEGTQVDSCGTHGYHINEPPDPRAIAVASRFGIDITDHRGRHLCAQDFVDYDLLLVMDRTNFRDAQRINGQPSPKLKLLRDYALGQRDTDVHDPYTGTDQDFVTTYQVLNMACKGIIMREFLQEKSV
jgi:protein-tyrosine phosphatase